MQVQQLPADFRAAADDSYTKFESVARWKEATKSPAVGFFPVYFPEELAHALDMLPVGLNGASGGVSLDIATAHTQSFVCSISRSVFQMALQGNLDLFEGLVFSNICDVARNLSGITKRNLPARYVEYLHYPINNGSGYAVEYLRSEYERLTQGMEKLSGRQLGRERLNESIAIYNEKRRLQRQLLELRRESPWLVPYSDWYSVLRAGSIMPVEQYVDGMKGYLSGLVGAQGRTQDRIRVAVVGNFCEQPPVMLMKVIEDAGCYVINDEALIGSRWLGQAAAGTEDPVAALARGYVSNMEPLTVRFHPGINKQEYIASFLEGIKAEGVVFLTPKFCEPALYDYMIFKGALDKTKLPYLHLEYEESSSSFEYARTMIETFAEGILFD
ncbi:MAG: 2-hydroxyacyl-CoA dehydratase [Nitrososphaerota archaeon]|nr:2-hydroxyacyl-CoA dehydratase [Nitrososphaerota archaeon]